MPKLSGKQLHDMSAAIFHAMGSAPAEAEEAAAHLVRANLTGHDSHGVGMLPAYMRLFAEGKLVPNQTLQTVVDDGPILVLDAGRGYGRACAEGAAPACWACATPPISAGSAPMARFAQPPA